VKDEVLRVVKEQRGLYPDSSVVVTGHSLGGAVATLAATYLRKADITADLYTYGSPRVGDVAFADAASAKGKGSTYRIVNKKDPVPHVPTIRMGYAHTTPEYWFPNGLGGEVKVCDGVQTLECSASIGATPILSPGDHGIANYASQFIACPGK
jgi:pimeloyl-ACP methyl ester carboxylesterase